MRMTLLEMTQDILNDMDADEVNSITDTVESAQVAQILKTSYYEMMSNRNWPHQRTLMQFDAVADLEHPNYLLIPEVVKKVEFFKYDRRLRLDDPILIEEIRYKEPDDFLRYVSNRRSTDTNVQTIYDYSGTPLLILNDQPPTYWTSFDDNYIVTDSYNINVEATIQKSKTQFLAYIIHDWIHADDGIPVMPLEAIPALLEEAKSTAFFTLKQMPNQKAEQKARRQQTWLAREAWRARGGVRYQNYGRKSRLGRR